MSSLRFLITAGPTQEPIDPVRYLSNYSSGKMGYALARAARRLGHRVILVSGPTPLPTPPGVKRIDAVTARELHRTVIRYFSKSDITIMVAAVADWRPVSVAKEKIKKSGRGMTLRLVPNPDILAALGRRKRKNQILVGFAAETRRFLPNAAKKLRQKKCDWIVLNPVGKKGIGFGSNFNQVVLLSRDGQVIPIPRQSKSAVAEKILKVILGNRNF